MVQSSQERLGDDAANCLNRPRNRCILAQRRDGGCRLNVDKG
jgi:hypothetical protein